ncbi:MAG: ATP-dependent Clp protease adaptor ClpS [Porphyromonadaceae bacterium]|nr:MAG: ATP-dependent Clp protease adaptor ClpS [Porphyromonadaceae bacterium]
MGRNVTKRNPDTRDLTKFSSGEEHFLVLHNDDVNTFDFVIDSLVEVCGHDPIQAEQCAFITHHQGKCDIKKGDVIIIKPMQLSLQNRGLMVTID